MKKTVLLSVTFLLSAFAFSQQDTEIFLFNIESPSSNISVTSGKNISNNEGYDNQPSFMNKDYILFSSNRNGQTDIIKYHTNYGSKTWLNFTEGGEYTPLKIPNKDAVSAVRLDPDGKQRLYAYSLKTSESTEIIKDLVVAYYTWYDENTIVSAVIEDTELNLYITDVNKGISKKYATNVGRSFHKIPNSNLVSFISKEDETQWKIKSLNPKTGAIKTIANTIEGVEDICWLNHITILSGKGSSLQKFTLNKDNNWKTVTDLSSYGITTITRLTTNPEATKLLIAAETTQTEIPVNTETKLEPKLENCAWIAGNWKGEAFGGITEENWSKPSGGSMMATFKLINDNKVSFYEIEIIREIENSLILQLKHFDSQLRGWETKDETVDFPLKEITPNKVIFEGMTFEKISDNEMNVYVDIHQKDGSIEVVKFNYKK
ncbi:hypothetical protein DMZ43_11525 [Meridianimaribacter sp. CL38]|uniref:DUF6265 family protein n=1 Tax=Meridianimaribacter sp. CL38 TaxID=2213021 RepID=UPI00103B286E|nr:DUF6265 family protein [Meridianimaribacter sp. CL38]TBV25567.1 hypothetical protein DMZ43_11525 [Meridianimaribacter sp. CL38]